MGNDIVDLDAPGAVNKSENSRFMKKVFTDAEIRHIRASAQPDAVLWGIWAAKETAFKVVAKSCPDALFSPKKYNVRLYRNDPSAHPGSVQTGAVTTPDGCVAVKVFFHEGHIHCIGVSGNQGDLATIRHGHGYKQAEYGLQGDALPPSARESLAVRRLALRHIARCFGRNEADMEIPGSTGPPLLYVNGRRDKIDISLSHDGRFVAYAFTLQHAGDLTVSAHADNSRQSWPDNKTPAQARTGFAMLPARPLVFGQGIPGNKRNL